MKIAILADIHANSTAFTEVLNHIETQNVQEMALPQKKSLSK
jgi:hypothetical protein